MLDPFWIYHITNIVGYTDADRLVQASIGYLSGTTFVIMKKDTFKGPYETVDYQGNIILGGYNKIRVRFNNAHSNDVLYAYANGYKRRI
jgi:hypothetical protein